MNTMNFSDALIALKAGSKLTRLGWRGGLWIKLIESGDYMLNNPAAIWGDINQKRDFIGLRAHDGSFGTCGLHDRDILADDWIIVE